jgi:demethylmenaquinone methyltransferase/2-methoxy-6-polyprenyl-1,4-benzoquinol methylase
VPTPLAPHAPLTGYYRDDAQGADRRAFLRRMFDRTACDYDRIERILALGSGAWYRRVALRRAGVAFGMEVLDVGIGTGLVAREALALVGADGRLVGVDPSPGMMACVRLPRVELLHGRAEALPCADAAFDFVSMGYALRHVSDVAAAFAEFHRVLRPGGRLLVLEITRPESRLGRALLKGYMRALVPLVARLVTRRRDSADLWRYYWDTIEACIAPREVEQALRAAGFGAVRRVTSLGVCTEYHATRPST